MRKSLPIPQALLLGFIIAFSGVVFAQAPAALIDGLKKVSVVLFQGKVIDNPLIQEVVDKVEVGEYEVLDFTTGQSPTKFLVSIKTTTTPIVPVTPPQVNPIPIPNPIPHTDVQPIGDKKLVVLFVEEFADRHLLPKEQSSITTSTKLLSFLNTHCAKGGPKGQTPEYRVWDDDYTDDDLKNESQMWKDVYKRSRSSLPWIVVSNGDTGFEGPLPGTVDETIELLKKFTK